MRRKLLIIGSARHGKDTVCELLQSHGYTFKSSSEVALSVAIYPYLKDKYGYTSELECFKDRSNHRSEWFDLVAAYNYGDKARLAGKVYESSDIYCGLRARAEFKYVKRDFNPIIIWVEAGGRRKHESIESNQLTIEEADIVIDNNGTMIELEVKVQELIETLRGLK
jgi:hypothetical protein